MRTRVVDATVSTMMALENTSRWPRFIIGLGRKLSSATKLVNAGKPLELGLAPKTARTISDSIDGYPAAYGVAWVTWASQMTPNSRNPSRDAIMVSALRAL